MIFYVYFMKRKNGPTKRDRNKMTYPDPAGKKALDR